MAELMLSRAWNGGERRWQRNSPAIVAGHADRIASLAGVSLSSPLLSTKAT